ncbi:DUF2911 domain-containing protein [Spirosoma agri]|jgi:hypothetical protein|uniref:DUF2911 domain-containing protein n=1 Tax=Spirosoma agri TaxID=1987381 RepID=A0A6M0IR22_9BACT|nr:DUF2911 domain-containing protein [Spirosoma agri]NEU69403.1 DUF2911 domain-containing protein [Spirosoma agri]
MTTTRINRILALTLAGVLMTMMAWAQGDKANRPSPPAVASGKVKDATITINYSSPSVKGRSVWEPSGKLAPYGQVWRAGANEATTFETDKAIKVEGKELPAGKYGFFAIPDEKEWTIIFNKVPNQWGAFKYDQAQDQLRVTAKPKKSAQMNEKLVYDVTNKGVVLKWENVEVPIAIQ